MKQIAFYKVYTGFIVLFFLTGLGMAGSRYNILFIVADDMNEYGFFKTNPAIKTPSLDKFRESAVSFKHAYCPAPACSPSRTAFLSGVSPIRSGKYYNGSTAWPKPLLTAQENMPEWFKRIGYSSYGKGKLFHAQIPKDRVQKCFDGGTGKAGFGPFPDESHRIGGSRFRGMQAFPDRDFPDVQNADEIVKLLGTNQEKPFFLMYGLWRPHSPYTCPQRFYDIYDVNDIQPPSGYLANDTDDLPLIAKKYIETKKGDFNQITHTEQQWKEYLKGYYACYTFADWNIGRVLDALEMSKYADNTIVVVTSDNGFHMGEKNRFDKNSLWELSAITPMAIRVPGTQHAGKVCTQPVNLQDLFPTFVDYCGHGKLPLKPIDGRSLRPLLENPNGEWPYLSMTYFGKGWISMRGERYRYLQYSDGSEELYDHDADIWELDNLVKDKKYSTIIKTFRRQIPAIMEESLPGRWTNKIKGIEKSLNQ